MECVRGGPSKQQSKRLLGPIDRGCHWRDVSLEELPPAPWPPGPLTHDPWSARWRLQPGTLCPSWVSQYLSCCADHLTDPTSLLQNLFAAD